MKLLIPFLLLTLLAGCNSKTNTIRVDDSRGNSSSGGSSSGGSTGGGGSGGSTGGGGSTTPGLSIIKGCEAPGYKRSETADEALYFRIEGIINGRSYNTNEAALWTSSKTWLQRYLYTDGVLRMRFIALPVPARNSTDQYGNICKEDPAASMNNYTKMQLLYRIIDGDGRVYRDGRFTAATVVNGTSDCSDVVEISAGGLASSSSRPFTIEIVGALSNLFCIRSTNGNYGCSELEPINSAGASSSTAIFPCVQFEIQVETSHTKVIPPKS